MPGRINLTFIGALIFFNLLSVPVPGGPSQPLSFFFDGRYGQVEMGGRYAGTEFHHSRPVPSRISFYYPVANSVDLSTDYWHRDQSQPMLIGIQVGGAKKKWISKEPWVYTLNPHKVVFHRQEDSVEYSAKYEFCFHEPAFVFTLTLRNLSTRRTQIQLYTHLRLSLRTCQTYARKDSSWIEYDKNLGLLTAYFDDPETDRTSLFVLNVGKQPSGWTSSAMELGVIDTGSSNWISSTSGLGEKLLSQSTKGPAVAAYSYEEALNPGDSLSVLQVIGSCRRGEAREVAGRLASSWHGEISAYDKYIHQKAEREAHFVTGDPWLDRSAKWARALLAANAHYLDGKIIPMPCPAEYNFFFTHDMLLTDLGAVQFDLKRVREDLLYLCAHSKDGIIPHAYYWRDNGFKTEFCAPDNWNHLWFILVTGSYLRHSLDDSTGRVLFPLVSKSLEEALKQRKPDNLMHAFRPDWWDIGRYEGARAYITILTIRALREYLYIGSFLGQRSKKLFEYERLANSMQDALSDRLWDNEIRYLINYNGESKDRHYYIGSLLGVVYRLLGPAQSSQLVETAKAKLVDIRIGVRNVAPADFHTAASQKFFKFLGNEAGDPYVYANGGTWPHGNAWYALALRAIGEVNGAEQFVRSTMTVDGVAQSPNGQPAMYEYRYADTSSTEFGRIDKPSFLWAGGLYLYTLYQLFGVNENEWNLSLAGPIPETFESVHYSLTFEKAKEVVARGKGQWLRSLDVDGTFIPSFVLPTSVRQADHVEIEFGNPEIPYVQGVTAILRSVHFEKETKSLYLELASFSGHEVNVHVITRAEPTKVIVDGNPITDYRTHAQLDGSLWLEIKLTGSDSQQKLEIFF